MEAWKDGGLKMSTPLPSHGLLPISLEATSLEASCAGPADVQQAESVAEKESLRRCAMVSAKVIEPPGGWWSVPVAPVGINLNLAKDGFRPTMVSACFSMFQRVWKQKHGIQFLDDLTNTTNGLKLPKSKRQMMVGFWVGVANRVFEPLKMPVGRQYICGSRGFQFSPIGRIFRRSMWPAWPGQLESHHCRFWNTQRNRSDTWDVHEWNKASTGKGKKIIFQSTISSHFQSFPAISSHLQDRRMNETG